MNTPTLLTVALRILLLTAATVLGGCGKFIYGVDIYNYGRHGVLVLTMADEQPFVRKPYITMGADGKEVLNDNKIPGLENVAFVVGLYPTIPSKYRDPASSFGRFTGYKRSLPKEVEVVWQLPTLTDCETETLGQSRRADRITWLTHKSVK